MKDINAYKERMLIEFEELIERIAKARAYLDDKEDKDLIMQVEAMEEYRRCLAIRILKEMGRY